MDAINELFGNIPLSQVITFFVAVAAILALLKKGYNKITTFHDFFQEREEVLDKVSNKIDTIIEEQEDLKKEVNEIKQRQGEIDAETRKHRLNKLRDRLLQMHRFYTNEETNPNQTWLESDRDSFLELYNDYVELGGNGHIEHHIYPEMMNLRVLTLGEFAEIRKKANTK